MEKGRAKDEKKRRRKSGGGKTEGRGTDSAEERARGGDGIVGTTKEERRYDGRNVPDVLPASEQVQSQVARPRLHGRGSRRQEVAH